MTYQRKLQMGWFRGPTRLQLNRDFKESMDEKNEMPSTQTLKFGTAGVCAVWLVLGLNALYLRCCQTATEGLARLIESKGGNEKNVVASHRLR